MAILALRGGHSITLNPGEGWGDGSHETTRLCLRAVEHFRPKTPFRALDFGSGSGVLSIALAKFGGEVDAVEIDEAAIAYSRVAAERNGVEKSIRFSRAIDAGEGRYDWIVANILRSVLIDFAGDLVRVLKPGGTLVLSGAVATDLPVLQVRYSELLGGRTAEVYREGEWCCLVFR